MLRHAMRSSAASTAWDSGCRALARWPGLTHVARARGPHRSPSVMPERSPPTKTVEPLEPSAGMFGSSPAIAGAESMAVRAITLEGHGGLRRAAPAYGDRGINQEKPSTSLLLRYLKGAD